MLNTTETIVLIQREDIPRHVKQQKQIPTQPIIGMIVSLVIFSSFTLRSRYIINIIIVTALQKKVVNAAPAAPKFGMSK